MRKEKSVTAKNIKAFSNEKILLKHSALSYQIDLYLPEHKLATEVKHTDRNINYQVETQEAIEEKLKCKFIRINPDGENCFCWNR